MALYEETRRLQEENDAKFSGTEAPDKTFIQAFRERSKALQSVDLQNVNPLDFSLAPSDTPKSWGRRLGPFYDPSVQQENFLAEQQSGWQRMGYMIPRIATKAVSEIVQLPGYLGGAVAWGLTGFNTENINMMVDNFWQRAVQGVEEEVKDRLPVYTADVVKNGNLLKNIFSTAFWANEGADGIGFLMGFLAPGAALRYAGFGAKMAKLIKPGTAIAKAGRVGQATEELTAAGMKLAGNLDDITSTLVNTLFESAAEGGETYRNILAETGDTQRAAEGAVDVVQKNFGILGISNYIDQKWLFGKYGLIKDYAKATKGLAKGSEYNRIFSTAVGEEGKVLDAVAKRTTWNQIGKLSKTITEGFLKEGFWEEGAQFAVSKHAEEETEDNEGFLSELTDIAQTYADNLFETDMQKSIFLGGVLGSTMAGVSTVREMKGTDKMLGNFHALVKENNLDRYTSMSDLYEIDPATNQPKIVNGKYQVDTNKAKEQLQRQFAKYIQSKQLVQLAKDGNVEAFEKIKDQRDLDYFMPFLQQQGGLEAAIYHINNLAETDMKWMKDEGVPIDVEQTKQDLINKVIKFQKIYDKISDTHDLNIDIKYNKDDQSTYDNFSNLVKSIKLGTEAGLKFSLDRIDNLRGQLSNYKVSENNTVSIGSTESNTSPKLVEDLKQALKENKTNLSDPDIISIENAIKNIEGHVTLVDRSRRRLGELYDNKVLQKEFESFKAALTKEDETSVESASNTTKAKKSKAAGLNPFLAKLYNDAVIYESFEGNDLRHSGQVAINYRNDAGQLNTLTAEVIEPNSSGNLTLKGVKNEGFDKDGKLVTIGDTGTHFLNSDGTLHYAGKTYKIEDEPLLVKTPKEVIEERRAGAIITSVEEMIIGYKNGIESIEDRIAKGIDYRNELQDRLNKLLDKEQKSQEETGTSLTKKGTERVQSVLQKRSRGKNIEQVFLTSKQLMDEIENADALITNLTSTRDSMKNNLEPLKVTFSEIRLSKDAMTSMNQILNSLIEMSLSYDDLITGTQESLESSKGYVKKLNNVLKGFHTSAARILGIEDQVNEIRSAPELTLYQKNATISDLIAVTFVNNTYSPEVYEEIATIQETIDKIQGNATQLQQNILELQKITNDNLRIKEGLNRLITLNRTILSRFNKNYLELAKKLGVLKSKNIPKEARVSTPEEKLANPKFRENVQSFIVKWESGKKHQFIPTLGDRGIDNWFVSTGNQKQAQSDDDVARWYNFVNQHAGKVDEGRHIYIFKTFTFSQVGKLEPTNFIRQNLKFTVDEAGTQMTYDQIKDKSNSIAENDIKIVAYERTGKLLLVGKNGEIGASDATNMIVSSLPLPNLKTKGGYDRFGVNKEKARFYKELGVTEDTATKLQKEAFDKYITKALEDSRKAYEDLREGLKSGGQIVFDINSINPGNKVTKNANDQNVLIEQDILSATGLKSTKSLYKKIHVEARKSGNDAYNTIVDRTYSGTEHGIINGYWYLRYNNRLELIKPKTFGETGSVDDILTLFQYVAKGLDSKNNEVRNYLQNIIYSGGENSPYQFYLDYEKGVKDFTGIVFGNSRISREDLSEGKNLEAFKAFLNTKFWNFNNKFLDQNEFVEYVVVDGKVTPKLWEFEDGGYKGFLFSNNPEHNNKTKGTVYIKSRAKDGLDLAREPQYENQSISLTRVDSKAKESTPTNPVKQIIGQGTTQKSTEGEKLIGGKPWAPFGSKPLDTTSTTTTQPKTINIYWGSNENKELSNFATRPFTINEDGDLLYGHSFKNVESAFQAYKVIYSEYYSFPDGSIRDDSRDSILKRFETTSGEEAKKLGKTIKGLNVEEWDPNASNIMKGLLIISFQQNPDALQKLLATGNAILTHTQDKGKWGTEFPKLLMEVRNELSSSTQTPKTEEKLIGGKPWAPFNSKLAKPVEANGLGDQTPPKPSKNNIEPALLTIMESILGKRPDLENWFGDTPSDKKHQAEFDHAIKLLKDNNIFTRDSDFKNFQIISILNGTAKAIRVTARDGSSMDFMDGGARDSIPAWNRANELLNNDSQFKAWQKRSNVHNNDILFPYFKNQIYSFENNPFGSYFEKDLSQWGESEPSKKQSTEDRLRELIIARDKKIGSKNDLGQRPAEQHLLEDMYQAPEGWFLPENMAEGKNLANQMLLNLRGLKPTTNINKELTSDEYWASIKEDRQSKYLKAVDGDLNKAKQNAYATYKRILREESPFAREASLYDEYERENLDLAKAWLKAKFPNIPVEIIDGLIDGKDWGRITKQATVLLSSIAATGTAYHEGFHLFSQLVLGTNTRALLYDEVRRRLPNQKAVNEKTGDVAEFDNKNLTDKEVEEILAEEFRMYMISPESYTFDKYSKEQKNFFQKLWDLILTILHLKKEDNYIEKVFDILNNGEFDVHAKELPDSYGRVMDRTRVPGLTDKETLVFTRDMNYRFFDTLFDPETTYSDTHLLDVNTEKFTEDIYDDIYNQYSDLADSKGPDSFYAKIVAHYEDMKKEHKRFLKQYNIDTRNVMENLREEEEDEDEELDNSSYAYRDPLTVDLIELIDNPVRMLIAGLPTVVKDSKLLSDLTEYKTRSTVRFNRIMRLLNENLADLGIDFNVYADKLIKLSDKYPDLKVLIERLRVGNDNVSESTLILRNQFVRVFAHHLSTPLMTNYKPNGVKNTFDARDQDRSRLIRTKWQNNAIASVGYKASLIGVNKRGAHIVNTTKLQQAIQEANNLAEGSRNRLNAYLMTLRGLGITITQDPNEVYNYKVVDNYIKRLSQEITARKGTELLVSDLFNANVVENQKETKALISLAKQYFLNDTDLSFYNQDGHREYPINLHSHTTDTIDLLNRITYDPETDQLVYPEEAEYLMAWDGSKGNLFNGSSYWREHQRTGGKIKVVDLKGIVDQFNNKNSSRISNATFGDYKSITFNALLHGIYIQLRSADRRRELGFMLINEDGSPAKVNYNVDQKMFKNRMLGYLKDELITSFALLIESRNGTNAWGNDLTNYRKNARELRTFKFLYDKDLNAGDKANLLSLERFVEDLSITDNRDTVTKSRELVDNYLSTYGDYIDRSFDRYIDKMAILTEKSLKEDSVITEKFTSKNESMGIYPRGIDKEVLIEMGLSPVAGYGLISRDKLNKLILFANYTSFIGNQEQLKYIMGDTAMWKDTTDFHKRVNGATSPKNKLADSEELRSHLDELYSRVDGKIRTDGVDIVVVEDIISSNETLGTKYPEYKETNGTDAESYATLDEYRDIMIRNGLWYNNHEKTYQFEMQNFVLRLLRLKNEGKFKHPFLKKISEALFTDPDGIFYKHTKGVLPESPMFNGKYLSETELGVLTIQKPQGFGHIQESTGLNTPQFFKTSTAPLFPSSIEEDGKMLRMLLSMMQAGQGILAFSSSMKGEIINSQNLFDVTGNVPKDGYSSQQLKYADFGLQLDISEEEKGEVTVSTQRTRLEFIDIFDNGKLKGNKDLLSLKEEYDQLTNDIVASERKMLLNDLGLTLNETTGRYDLQSGEDVKKFKKKLIDSFNFALLPYNIIDGMDLSLDSSEKVFDMAVNKRKIEEVLTSLIKKNVIGRKTKGDMLVQESSVLYDQNLEFYRESNGKVLPMDVVVSLPIDLIPVMKRVGGLKNLNDAIKAHDTKLLGEDFFKILDIPMNRIPGQSLSSLDIGRVKYFLPYYHGSKVILPPEIVTKTGSDFDVDKMTAYFHYYKVEDGKVVYHNYPGTNLEVMKNRLNNIAIEATLHSSRFSELVRPLTSKNVKRLTNEYNKKISKTDVEQEAFDTLGKQSNKWDNIVTWWYNMQKGHEFFSAKKGTAIAAVHNAANAFSQQHPIRMKAIVPLFFKGQELTSDEYYNTGFVYDSDDHLTSRNFGEFLSAFVDVVKDPFIFDLTDSNTFNTIALLNRYGKNSGIGLESIVAFMTQPAIREYLRVRRENSPKFLGYNDRINFKDQYGETVQRLRNQIGSTEYDASIPMVYGATIASSLNNLFDVQDDYDKKEATKFLNKKITESGYKAFSKKELRSKEIRTDFKAQVQILDNFMTYQVLAQKLVSLNLILRPDARSSMGRHLSSIEAGTSIPQQALLNTGLFHEDDFRKAIGGVNSSDGQITYPKTLLTEFFRTQLNISGYFGDFFLVQKDPVISTFFAENIIPYLADPNKWKKKADVDRALIDVESDLMSFIIADSLDKKSFEDMVKFYQDTFMNENSVPKELLKLKGLIEGNVAINELDPKIAERINKTRAIAETDNISLFNKNFNVQELDAIESDLYALGVEPNERNKKFVYNLMLHSVFQSGFNSSANSYMGSIPNRLFIDIAEKAISRFQAMTPETKEIKLRSFSDQFFRNNAANTKIVPRHPWPMRASRRVKYWFTKTYEDKKNFYKDYNYIAFNYYTHNPKSYFKAGTNPPMDIVLYRRIPGEDNVFEVISKQGEGSRMKEYYPMLNAGDLDNASVLESNRYNVRPLDVTYTEEESSFDSDLSSTDEDLEGLEGGEPLYFDASKLNGEDFKYLPDGVKNTYFKALKSKAPLHQALRMIEENSTNKGHVKLAKILRSAVKTAIPLYISKDFFKVDEHSQIPEVVGIYDPIGREAHIYESLDDTGFEVATLHEAMHALTYDEIKKNPEFRKRIQKIADYAYYSILKSGENQDIIQSGYDLFTNPDEFVAHAFTNGKFQNILAQIEAENPELVANQSKKISVFADFMNELMSLIRKYFDIVFGTTYAEYNNDLQVLDSVLQDLIVTVEENMLKEFKPESQAEVVQEVSTDKVKAINRNELAKDPSTTDFNTLYPQYSYLNESEREAFNTLIDQGKLQIACKV